MAEGSLPRRPRGLCLSIPGSVTTRRRFIPAFVLWNFLAKQVLMPISTSEAHPACPGRTALSLEQQDPRSPRPAQDPDRPPS